MSIKNINNTVWVVTWVAAGESYVEYFRTEAEAMEFIRSQS